jgi:hypothetical protein
VAAAVLVQCLQMTDKPFMERRQGMGEVRTQIMPRPGIKARQATWRRFDAWPKRVAALQAQKTATKA